MEPFIGQIIMFAGNFAPRGWALCDGQHLSISNHSALFSILGTIYGGDGETTFRLPDLRGRVAVHKGSGPGLPPVSLGQKAGEANTTLNENNLPPHTHSATNTVRVKCQSGAGISNSPVGNYDAVEASGFTASYSGSADGQKAADAVEVETEILNTGNGTAFDNMQPYLGVNYIIALVGTFPSRN